MERETKDWIKSIVISCIIMVVSILTSYILGLEKASEMLIIILSNAISIVTFEIIK